MREKQKKAEEKKQKEEEDKIQADMAKKGDMSYMKQFEELNVDEDDQ